ncbi:hypothetical protein PV08_10961 [Exophiala spinifera]|uniref:Protein FYV10 n=1 Tax=Exophiala spinifera TaxID=91928 RepID=A0A0D2BK58_9EURO|nr:uncharacterized protein PV08_10961 [Exophiala spinifera]KIW11659.1 hypothetical protein PV08_10961 [Exophiala spinifera]
MADGAGSNRGPRSAYFNHIPRRMSYASVASGANPQSNLPAPQSEPLSHLAANFTPSSSYPSHESESQIQGRQPPQEHESNGSQWRTRTPFPRYSRKFSHIHAAEAGMIPVNQFFVPSYLRASRYVAKLEAAHKAKLKREREHPPNPTSGANSLSTSAGHSNAQRLAPSHRGMTYDIIESNPPRDDLALMPLPSRWSEQDKYPGLDAMNEGLELKYTGSGSKAEIEAASVRADYPMPSACGIYYFEVEIKHKSKDTAIAIGFSTAEASLERLPGWETHSWGYHGDDGKMFCGEHSGRHYGPTFDAGDVIGCGVNFNAGHAFFTKNGQDLGVCFKELKKDLRLFPTVGMKKHTGALVAVNFGQRPFVFDIDDKMESERDKVAKDIDNAKPLSLTERRNETTLVQDLVMQFLSHDGYVETARAFAEEVQRQRESLSNTVSTPPAAPPVDDTEALNRQKIRRAILFGDIDRALEATQAHFPSVLAQNPNIVFKMKCRKWIELIRKTTELNARKNSAQFGASAATDDDFAQDMDLDDQPNGGSQSNGLGKAVASETVLLRDQYLMEAMAYGQELSREYGGQEDHAQTLNETFSLLAYDDPTVSVNGHLLDPSVFLGRPPAAYIERIWRQTDALLDTLVDNEGGAAAFVNVRAAFET